MQKDLSQPHQAFKSQACHGDQKLLNFLDSLLSNFHPTFTSLSATAQGFFERRKHGLNLVQNRGAICVEILLHMQESLPPYI